MLVSGSLASWTWLQQLCLAVVHCPVLLEIKKVRGNWNMTTIITYYPVGTATARAANETAITVLASILDVIREKLSESVGNEWKNDVFE